MVTGKRGQEVIFRKAWRGRESQLYTGSGGRVTKPRESWLTGKGLPSSPVPLVSSYMFTILPHQIV